LISQNFKVFGNKETAKKAIVISLISTTILIGTFIFLPESIASKIPYIAFTIIPVVVTNYVVRTYQSKEINEYLKKDCSKASSLEVFGKSIVSLLIMVIIVSLLLNLIDVKYNYGNYLKNYCNSSYNEGGIQKNKVYVPEDASCFVHKRLENKGYTLKQIDKVLTLEFEYQKKIGLIDKPNQTVSNNSTPYNPLPFILEHQTIALSDEQINEILTDEEEYLKLIGTIENKTN